MLCIEQLICQDKSEKRKLKLEHKKCKICQHFQLYAITEQLDSLNPMAFRMYEPVRVTYVLMPS